VTGTNGKTTTATLLYKIATGLGLKAGLIGTVENIIIKEVRVPTHTTPDSVSLTRLLYEMAQRGCQYVFMEVSSHAIDQGRVRGINFSGGIFTNLTHEHLDYHRNIENYFQAKKKFFDSLPASAFALSNSDDEYGKGMIGDTRARKFYYGFDNASDFRGEIKSLNYEGLELACNGSIIKSKLLGRFNAYNLLTVWGVCHILGFDMAGVGEILEDANPPRGRFERLDLPNGAIAIVDYAHTPDALEKVFLTAVDLRQGGKRLISVFGCGGDRDPDKRPMMGQIGARYCDIAIFTSDNPRGEDPEKIIKEMQTGLSAEEAEKVLTITDRREAIKKAVSLAQRGDILLVAGKGHENYQETKGGRTHFDDAEELKN
jgi:UDP-N-acetylmuramoyl-L-alanyl-D-glutamate--2,6-diaminopimelate ligase